MSFIETLNIYAVMTITVASWNDVSLYVKGLNEKSKKFKKW